MTNSISPLAVYQRACRRYLDSHSIEDYDERAQELGQVKEMWRWAFLGLTALMESEDTEVWHALGDAFQNGRGTESDSEAAVGWFRKAAEAGHSKSMVRLGLALQRSRTNDNQDEAIRWFRDAADRGEPSGMIWLGFAYREGTGVPINLVEAVQLFIKAVEAGDNHSMIHVGRMYSGDLNQPAEAIKWFLRAAEAGFSESHYSLALLYDDRRSPVHDPVEAVKWWSIVAEGSGQSRFMAMHLLACYNRDGTGTPRNTEMAKEWLRRLMREAPEKTAAYRDAARKLQEIQTELL